MAHPSLGLFVQREFSNDYPGKNVHQLYVEGKERLITRVQGGVIRAEAHWQLCLIRANNNVPSSGIEGDYVITYGATDVLATPTGYVTHEPRDGTYTYNFQGFYHQDRNWNRSNHLNVIRDRYQNGFQDTIFFDVDNYIIEACLLWIPRFIEEQESVAGVESLAPEPPEAPETLNGHNTAVSPLTH